MVDLRISWKGLAWKRVAWGGVFMRIAFSFVKVHLREERLDWFDPQRKK